VSLIARSFVAHDGSDLTQQSVLGRRLRPAAGGQKRFDVVLQRPHHA
jgi:hypothetical protein